MLSEENISFFNRVKKPTSSDLSLPNIKWESTTTANLGLDFGFGKNLVSGNLDLYRKDTRDLLNTVTIPMGANFSNSLLTNIGSMVNKGIELGVQYNPIRKRNTSLSRAKEVKSDFRSVLICTSFYRSGTHSLQALALR